MILVEEVARSVLAAVDSDAGPELAAKWVSERYAELVGRVRFRHLRRAFQLYIAAPTTAGTAAVTLGSNIVTGTGTAWTTAMVDRYFRFSIVWYRIAAVRGQTLTLEAAVSEQSNAAASYYIVQRYVKLPSDIRWIGDIALPRLRTRLRHLSMDDLMRFAPSRQRVGSYPSCWTEGPDAPDKGKQVEIYPPSNQAENYDAYGWPVPPPLPLRDVVPPEIDAYVLREGALADVCRYNSSRALNADPPNLELAKMWDKRYVDQLTIWEQKIDVAAQTDRGSDDVSVIVWPNDDSAYPSDFDSIRTAREWVWARLDWP